jgi:hypothetical protein
VIRVVVGTQEDQYVCQKVLERSILDHASEPVEVHFRTFTGERLGGTSFGFVRFLVPSLFGWSGRAIYLDCDQLVFGDIRELHDALDEGHDVALVQAPEGEFRGKPVGRHNQTSVMVLDCARLRDWDPATLFERVVPARQAVPAGKLAYREFMKIEWMDPRRLQPLDPRWNHFNIVRPDTRLVHFSNMRTQPWKDPEHAVTDLWEEWLRRTVVAGGLRRRDVLRAVWAGHLHRRFLRTVTVSRRVARWLDRRATASEGARRA